LAYPHGVSMARFARKLRTLRISHTSIYTLSLNSCLPRQGAPAAMPPPLRVSACWRPLAIKMRRCNIRTCACLEGMLYTSIYSKPAHALRATDTLLRLLRRRGFRESFKFFFVDFETRFFRTRHRGRRAQAGSAGTMVVSPAPVHDFPRPCKLCRTCRAVSRARPPAWHASAIFPRQLHRSPQRRRGGGDSERVSRGAPGRGLSGGGPGRGWSLAPSALPRGHAHSASWARAGGRGPGAHGFARARPLIAR
jgi:hypothetical protein